MKNIECQKIFNKHYVIAFWITLCVSLGLIIGGFFVPPRGIIDGSILTATGIIFLWPSLAALSKAIESGRVARLNFGHNSLNIGQDYDKNGFDDNWEMNNNDIES